MVSRRIAVLLSVIALSVVAGCGGDDAPAPAPGTANGELDLGAVSSTPVAFSQVQEIFTTKCSGCHPTVNNSIDLSAGNAYADIVGVGAVEAPGRVRVIAGDPDASFLFQKVIGSKGLGDIPDVGTRMPPMAARLPESDLRIIRDWIAQGAKNDAGQTVSGSATPTPGAQSTFAGAPRATSETGSATLTGIVRDQRGKPIAGAVVTLLLKGSQFPDGEEHVRGAITGADGRYTLPKIPSGRLEAKAYAPKKIYVARIVEVAESATASADFGLPDRLIQNPTLTNPTVTVSGGKTSLAVDLAGRSLDRNYTIAVNVATGKVLEFTALTDAANETVEGRWTREFDEELTGEWIFLAADETCNISDFLRVNS